MRTFYRGMGYADVKKMKKRRYMPKGMFITPTYLTAEGYVTMWEDDVKHHRVAGKKQIPVVITIKLNDGEYEGTWKDAKYFGEAQLKKKISTRRIVKIVQII